MSASSRRAAPRRGRGSGRRALAAVVLTTAVGCDAVTGEGPADDGGIYVRYVGSEAGVYDTYCFPVAQEPKGRIVEIDRIEDPYGNRGQRAAAAWLYDLSDGRRWSRADAETHEYPRAVLTGVRKYEGCDYMRRPGRSGL